MKYTLSYPGQNHGPFDPTKSQSCSVKRTTNASCADAFAAMFQVPQYTSPFAFNPVYLPLAAPVRRGVPDDYVLTGEVPCPTSSGKCQQWNFTEASPKCGRCVGVRMPCVLWCYPGLTSVWLLRTACICGTGGCGARDCACAVGQASTSPTRRPTSRRCSAGTLSFTPLRLAAVSRTKIAPSTR